MLGLDDEKQSHPSDNPNAIRARSIPQPTPAKKAEEEVVTLTVSEDGELNIPTPSIEALEAENEIEPTSAPHRFEPRVKILKKGTEPMFPLSGE